jgi:hypothetical protein
MKTKRNYKKKNSLSSSNNNNIETEEDKKEEDKGSFLENLFDLNSNFYNQCQTRLIILSKISIFKK